MNKTNYTAQVAANFVACHIRRSGMNVAERIRKLREVFDGEFVLSQLAEVLDDNWKSPEQIEAERKAEAEAQAREAEAQANKAKAKKAA